MKFSARLIALVSAAALEFPGAAISAASPPDFAVPRPAPAVFDSSERCLDLDDVLSRVLERNPSLAAARAARTATLARIREDSGLDDPMLDVMAAPRSFAGSSVDPSYRIGLTQSFPIFGQRGIRRRKAGADADASAWDLRTAQLDLLHEARLTYVEYWRVGRAIELNRELLGVVPQLRRVSLARYSAGLAGQQEPLAVDAELAMLDHEAVVLERQRRIAVAGLNVLMHDPPEGWLPPPPDTLAVPDTSVIHSDLAPRARALRPESAAAAARVRSSEAELALAQRMGLPGTSFGVAYDRFWSEPELRTSVSISMNLPIQLGRLSAARAEARARLEASRHEREAVRDRIDLQVAIAAARLHEQAHDVRIARERMVPLAQRTLGAARASYEANRTDFVTVLNSLRDYLRARLEADESLATLEVARADLDRALGELPSALEKEKQP